MIDDCQIEVVALSNFENEEIQFKAGVVALRQRIITSSTSGDLVPASGFGKYAEDIWDDIKEDKILNLQLNKITIAELCCHRLAEEKYTSFCKHESWLQVKKGAQSGDAVGLGVFGRKLDALIDNYLSEELEAMIQLLCKNKTDGCA
ncbi:hypothetical protein ACH5RR_032068 [Cinchona calisaya]|uniref:Uncharacterized protein n=1 Tax=Cinchona calisaya TaxID=153742 RepID=A0ABD2YIE0_9GENT